jgi:hypothetical protein
VPGILHSGDEEGEEEDDDTDIRIAVPVAMWDFDHRDPRRCRARSCPGTAWRHRCVWGSVSAASS